jgi:hypothetical protein
MHATGACVLEASEDPSARGAELISGAGTARVSAIRIEKV